MKAENRPFGVWNDIIYARLGTAISSPPLALINAFLLRSNISHAEINLLGSILLEKLGKLSFWNYLKIMIRSARLLSEVEMRTTIIQRFIFRSRKLQWNPDFSNPHFFQTSLIITRNKSRLPLVVRTLTVILPPMPRTIRFFQLILVSIGGWSYFFFFVYVLKLPRDFMLKLR